MFLRLKSNLEEQTFLSEALHTAVIITSSLYLLFSSHELCMTLTRQSSQPSTRTLY